MNQRPPPTNPPISPASEPDGSAAGDLLDELSEVEFSALRWSVRAADGLDAASRAEFEQWLDSAPAHRAAYREMSGVMDELDHLPADGTARLRATVAIDVAATSAARPAAVRVQTETETRASAGGARPRRRPQALALAALAVLSLGGWLGWNYWQQPVFSQHYATARGQQLAADLPDGSHLQLDTATSADVTLYRDRRQVRLPEGQVVFKVQGDRGRHFDVLAGAARITVVGTKFSVRYTPSLGPRALQVAVMEGKVRVQGKDGPADEVYLLPGQTIGAGADGKLGAVTAMPVEAMAPWRERRLNFDNVALAEVLTELSRYGDTGLSVRDPAVARLTVTTSVDLGQLDAFARSLPQVLPVRLQARGGVTEIVAQK